VPPRRAAVGWRTGDPQPYVLAVAVAVVLLPLTYVAFRVIPSGSVADSAHLHVSYGQASTLGDYLAILLLAVAEEILFRSFIAGLLFRRYGFATGNVIQAFIFLAPHLLLLLSAPPPGRSCPSSSSQAGYSACYATSPTASAPPHSPT